MVAQSQTDYEAGAQLFQDYARSLQIDLSFQGFSEELQQLPQMYGPPHGCLLLAHLSGAAAGCIGVRLHAPGLCEMKRLYVGEALRGNGAGRALALRAIAWARMTGYQQMLLDTLGSMHAARRLYQSLGFQPVEPYYRNPIAGSSFMALDLALR